MYFEIVKQNNSFDNSSTSIIFKSADDYKHLLILLQSFSISLSSSFICIYIYIYVYIYIYIYIHLFIYIYTSISFNISFFLHFHHYCYYFLNFLSPLVNNFKWFHFVMVYWYYSEIFTEYFTISKLHGPSARRITTSAYSW